MRPAGRHDGEAEFDAVAAVTGGEAAGVIAEATIWPLRRKLTGRQGITAESGSAPPPAENRLPSEVRPDCETRQPGSETPASRGKSCTWLGSPNVAACCRGILIRSVRVCAHSWVAVFAERTVRWCG